MDLIRCSVDIETDIFLSLVFIQNFPKKREEEIVKNWNFTPQLIQQSPWKNCKSLSNVTYMLQFPIFSLPSRKRGLVTVDYQISDHVLFNRSIGSWNGTPLSEKPYICVAQGKGHCTIFLLLHICLSLPILQKKKNQKKNCRIIFVYYC